MHGSSIVARVVSTEDCCRKACCSASDLAQIGVGRSIEYVVVLGNSSMSDKFDVYEQTSHWIKPVPSTFKVARQFGQNGHVMVTGDHSCCEITALSLGFVGRLHFFTGDGKTENSHFVLDF
jgi:hypothetical protein